MLNYLLIIAYFLVSSFGCLPESHDTPSQQKTPPQQKPAAHQVLVLPTITKLTDYIEPNTLFVFDIDATLVWVPGHTWPFKEVTSISLPEGALSLQTFNIVKAAASNHTTAQGSKVIFLTARPMNESAENDLQTAGISISPEWLKNITFNNLNQRGLKNGIMYSSHSNKGEMLKEFLESPGNNYTFNAIVFIDDQESNITKVHTALKNLPYVKKSSCLYYQGAIHPVHGPVHPN